MGWGPPWSIFQLIAGFVSSSAFSQCDCGDLDKSQRNQERCIETDWMGGWGEWVGVCTEHDNEEAKKPRWRDLSIIPSLTAVIVRIPHPTHCTPLCTTAVVELHLGRTFDLRIRFFNFFGKLLIRQSFTSLANISSHQCTGHPGHNHLHPDKQMNDA